MNATLAEDSGNFAAGTTFTAGDARSAGLVALTSDAARAGGLFGPMGTTVAALVQASAVKENVLPNQAPIRTIADKYTERVYTTAYYGQNGSPRNGTWVNSINIGFTLNLQKSTHLYKLSWAQLQGRFVTFKGFVSLNRMNGYFTPSEVDFNTWGGSSVSSYTQNSNLYRDGLSEGIYSAKVWKMNVKDASRAFSMDVGGDFSTHRFSCPKNKQCLFPNGKEAPVLG